ncbi:MAG: LuxR C-terminal-related transcriptional regulator [Pseudomonadota bacterium]
MAKTIAVAIIEQNHVLREGFRRVLSRSPLRVVGLWPTIAEAVGCECVVSGQCDVFVIGIGRSNAPSAQDVLLLREASPDAHLVMVTDAADHPALTGPLGAMVDGALLQSASADALIKSIEVIMLGERFFPASPRQLHDDDEELEHPSGAASTLHGHEALATLSPRERQVLAALRNGAPNKLIARQLEISDATVKVHVKSILRKTGARNRTEAALWAVGLGASVEIAQDPASDHLPNGPQGGRD